MGSPVAAGQGGCKKSTGSRQDRQGSRSPGHLESRAGKKRRPAGRGGIRRGGNRRHQEKDSTRPIRCFRPGTGGPGQVSGQRLRCSSPAASTITLPMFFKTGTGGRHGRGRFPVLLLFTVLLGVSLCSPHAQAIDPPATVPSESAIADDAANLSLKKDLDRRYPGLEQRFQSWNSQASACNAKYTGHDLDDGSKEARAGKTEQARLSKLLTSYENDARAFKADVEKLRLKSAGAPPEPAVSAQVGAD